ncbi:hypothetical protein HDV05_005747 [Chytridiales sp. JEL 0842]|nr:hypothetical protein HDV05_005747 [Chytridiales sp. JEL 0842]
MSGPRLLVYPKSLNFLLKDPSKPPTISSIGEEKVLLILDRVLSVLALAAVIGTCGFPAIGKVITTKETAWIAPLAFASAALGEVLGKYHTAGYSLLHSAWHFLVYHLPFACVSVAIESDSYRPFIWA